MKLIINKFPPITERCEIDLSKKVTLFVGKNNSGKTYLSQLIWGINNFDKKRYLNQENLKPIKFIDTPTKKSIILTQNMLNKISLNFTKYLNSFMIKDVFKQDMSIDFEVKLDLDDALYSGMSIPYDSNSSWIEIKRKNKEWIISLKHIDDNEIQNIDVTVLNKFIELISISLFIQKNTTYMPSTRLFLPSFYKYIARLEKEIKDDMFFHIDKLKDDNKNFFKSSYTKPFDDLIKKLIFTIYEPLSDNRYLNKMNHILEGSISIDRAEFIGMVDISYSHKSGQNIPMYLSSSMVNQLSMLYLYFKYWFHPMSHDFLLLDEPEMNLHPSKKIKVMELLLDFASENKLLIATHSSSVAKSLINYIHLFDLKEKKGDLKSFIKENELDMNLDINLKSNDIGIYYFNGETIISYKRDNDSDIHFGTFSEIEELQNKQYDYIMDELDQYDL